MKGTIFCRVAPFALFMTFVGLEEALRFLTGKGLLEISPQVVQGLYPVKALAVALVLFLFPGSYDEINMRDLAKPLALMLSVAAGLAVFAFWVRLDLPWATIGKPAGFDPNIYTDGSVRSVMTAFRLFGAVLVVPVMEELFWRSFLIRYIVSPDFSKVPVGHVTWPSFLVTAVLFGLEHNLVVAGILAGIVYNALLCHTRSLSSCILAHAVTNLALGIYVLTAGRWYFW